MLSFDPIIEFLITNYIENISQINFILNGYASEATIGENSVYIRGKSDHNWVMIVCPEEEYIKEIEEFIRPDDKFFAVADEWLLHYFRYHSVIDWELECVRFIYDISRDIKQPTVHIESLLPEDAEYVFKLSNYREFTNIEYFRDRIKNGPTAAIRENGKLAAWVMTHDEGSIGCLHVIDEFRQKGYASELLLSMALYYRMNDKIPYVDIEVFNQHAMGLVKKIGFKPYKKLFWFKLK